MTEDTNFSSSHIAVCVFNALLCFTTITMNSLTIHAIRKTASLPTPLKIFLLSLAVSDLGVGLLVQPLGIARFVMEMEPNAESSPTYITMKNFAFRVPANLFYYATFFCISALTVDRFLAIHLHLRYQELITKKRTVAVVISVWTLSAFLSLFPLWIPQKTRTAIYGTIELVCFITTTLLNSNIYLTVRRHTREIQALQIQQEAQNGETINAARQGKSALGTFYVYVAFLACYLPIDCYYVATLTTNLEKNLLRNLVLYTWTLAWLNSSLNPLIYCWKIKQIRHAMTNILRNILPGHN